MVSDLKTFAHKGCKIAAQKKVSFSANFALLAGFVLYAFFVGVFVGNFFVRVFVSVFFCFFGFFR